MLGDQDALATALDGLLQYGDRVVARSGSMPQREAAEFLAWLDKNVDVLLTFDPLLPPEKRRTRPVFELLETLRSAAGDGSRTADVRGLPEFDLLWLAPRRPRTGSPKPWRVRVDASTGRRSWCGSASGMKPMPRCARRSTSAASRSPRSTQPRWPER